MEDAISAILEQQEERLTLEDLIKLIEKKEDKVIETKNKIIEFANLKFNFNSDEYKETNAKICQIKDILIKYLINSFNKYLKKDKNLLEEEIKYEKEILETSKNISNLKLLYLIKWIQNKKKKYLFNLILMTSFEKLINFCTNYFTAVDNTVNLNNKLNSNLNSNLNLNLKDLNLNINYEKIIKDKLDTFNKSMISLYENKEIIINNMEDFIIKINEYNKLNEERLNYIEKSLMINNNNNKILLDKINMYENVNEKINEINYKLQKYALETQDISKKFFLIEKNMNIYDKIIKNYNRYIKNDYDKKNLLTEIYNIKNKITLLEKQFFIKKKEN